MCLTKVEDGYGRELQFTYYSGETGDNAYKNGQLKRIQARNTNSSPSDLFDVDLDYTPEKNGGVTIGSPKALLAKVTDTRGKDWTYDYYGQSSGETTANLLNFLTERTSPSVDTTGDGSVDGPLTLENLTYKLSGSTITAITQQRGNGLLNTNFAFQADGQNVTTEEVAGQTTIHHFANGVYAGQSNPAGDLPSQAVNDDYRSAVQADGNANQTLLEWSSGGEHLDQVTDALNHETSFNYNTNDTLNYNIDAQGRKTEYTYGDVNQPRLPTRIKVFDSDLTTVLTWQEFTYDSKGRTLTEKTFDPADGTTLLQQVTRAYHTSGEGNGLLQTVTQEDVNGSNDVSTTYTYDGAGRVVQSNQSSSFGSCTIQRTVYDEAGNVVATLCNFNPGTTSPIYPTTVAQAKTLRQRLYNTSDPDHYADPNTNRLMLYEYDELGRRVKVIANAEDPYQQTTVTVYDALNRVIRTVGNYVADTAVPNPYTAPRSAFTHGVEDNQNLVTDTAYNARGLVKRQTDVLGNATLYGYDEAGRLAKAIQSVTRRAYNNDYGVDSAGTLPDIMLGSYLASDLPDKDVINLNEYDAAGNLVKTTDALGNVHYTVYDALNRPVKTVRSAKVEATIALNPGDNLYNATNDPRSSEYVPSLDPDRDLIDTTEYDAMGRVIRTRRLLDNVPTEQWDTTLYGYDAIGRQVKVIRSASQPDYNVADDPSLSKYVPSEDADQDVISFTAYDPAGRTMYSEDATGHRTWMAYDGLGRSIRTAANAVGTATNDGVKDPRSPYYNPVISHGDRDIIVSTTYDSDGRVLWTQDALRRKMWSAYDEQGRVVRTITNAVGTATDNGPRDPRSPIYIRSTHSDQDLVTETVYDEQGRVSATIDTRGNQTKYVYDKVGRRTKTITNFVDGIANASVTDEDRIQSTTYDLAGRVVSSFDTAGIETRYLYDALGRRTRTIANFVAQGHDPANWLWSATNSRWEDGRGNPINHGMAFDRNLISDTTYNKGGQVIATCDARGTQTTFTYDATGRRLTITQAANTPLASTSYTCYDKAGRTRRSIQNWIFDPTQPAPDAREANGNWLFIAPHNSQYNDRNLVALFDYDRGSRRIKVTNPVGSVTTTSYFKDGQVKSITDPEGTMTRYCYDGMRRRNRVIAGFVDNGEDPSLWIWNSGWKKKDGTTAIIHGTLNDQNVIVDVVYDKAGRVTQMREPRGNLTTYKHDLLDRRTHLKNPLNQTWTTTYADLNSGTTRTTLTDPNGVNTQREFDRLGRLASLTYGDPATTPDVKFTYNTAGNRSKMTEFSGAGFTTPIRETTYTYDQMRRLTSVGFDNDGSGSIDETVSYEYDKGGLRTKLTLPGNLTILYTYNQRGQLVSLTDWDSQKTEFAHDLVGRHIATMRANGLHSRYHFDAGGRLRLLRHTAGFKTFAHFAFDVDKRGNRTQALECLAHPTTTTDTTIAYNDKGLLLKGTWSDVGGFKETTNFGGTLKFMFLGDNPSPTGNLVTLTMGTGPDHSIYDVYVGGSLWQSFDGYAASASQMSVNIQLYGEGPHLLEIRNRPEKNKASTGFKVRFKQLVILDKTFDLHTIAYTYDALSRVREARYNPNINTGAGDADLLRRYQYTFDLAGNRTQQIVTVAGSATTTNYTYNAANQLTSGSATYDNNGNMTSDGTNTHTWDRANRLLSMGGVSNRLYRN